MRLCVVSNVVSPTSFHTFISNVVSPIASVALRNLINFRPPILHESLILSLIEKGFIYSNRIHILKAWKIVIGASTFWNQIEEILHIRTWDTYVVQILSVTRRYIASFGT